jgi:cell wall-associated NlpC family hydrolase
VGRRRPDGFDCSGLVRFIYDQVGIPVPRTAAEQFSAAKPIQLTGLEPGDLLFFRTHGQRISHVAIYTGEGRFIHAPRSGQPVEFRMLDDEYYRTRLAGAEDCFRSRLKPDPQSHLQVRCGSGFRLTSSCV